MEKKCTSISQEASLEAIFNRHVERIPKMANQLRISERPSVKRPFVFFHLRKTSGTGTRFDLFNASQKLGLKALIGCQGDTDCRTYNLPLIPESQIYGGHLYYSDVKDVLGFSPGLNASSFTAVGGEFAMDYEAPTTIEPRPKFDCMASMRATVDRVVSCWQFRFVVTTLPGWKQKVKPAGKLRPEEWRTELPLRYSAYLEGCNNEVVRAMGTLGDEQQVNTLTSDLVDTNEGVAENQLDIILSRLSRCVPLLRKEHCQDSQTVINHFVPWFGPFNRCNQGEVSYQNGTGTGKIVNVLSNESKAEILRQNILDDYAYRYSELFFKALLEIASSNKTET